MSREIDVGDLSPRELKQAAKLEKKRKKQEEQIKRKNDQKWRRSVKVAAMRIPLRTKGEKRLSFGSCDQKKYCHTY